MARNIEIKARLSDFDQTAAIARELSGGSPEVLEQEDVFFPCPAGRLKLRIFSPVRAELIHYRRPDQNGPKTSDYLITPTSDPAGLREALTRAYGVRRIVRKTRLLFLVGRTRIHLDRVEDLGDFLELEVVLEEAEPEGAGELEARNLMDRLGISAADLVPDAYVDLLEDRSGPVTTET